MFRRIGPGLCTLAFLLLTLTALSQQKWPNTLLWRISGNGLTTPSYLYGTMHLQDKRLFQFGDSLYRALETTEGMATEIDFNEYMDSVLHNSLRKKEAELLLAKQQVTLNRKNITKTGDSLLRNFGIKGNTLTKKDLKDIRDYRMRRLLQQGEMPTIVDAYLLGLARRQDKWTGGIEDVSDQLNLSDELGGALQPEVVLQPDEAFKKTMEKMVRIYVAQDLNAMDTLINFGFTTEYKDLMLINRNRKMARRMDSLSHRRSMLFAVGTAHLPGDSGVISFLRSRGFTVQPVFSSSKVPADVYAAKLKSMEWLAVEGEEKIYTVKMPGKPSDYDAFGELVKMKMFFDITSMTFYMAGSVTGPNATAGRLDELMKSVYENMTHKKTGLKLKTITMDGLEGRETTVENKDGVYRLQIGLKNKTVFMLMAGSPQNTGLNGEDANKFFTSFTAGNTQPAKKEWTALSLPDKAFSVRMPGRPRQDTATDAAVEHSKEWVSTSYQSVDPHTGFYYLMQVRELTAGRYLTSDSAYFEQVKEGYKSILDNPSRSETGTRNNLPVLYLDGESKTYQAFYKTVHIIRGNRVYSLLCGVALGNQNSADPDSFLNSLSFLPYAPVAYVNRQGNGFSAYAPDAFKKIAPDSGTVNKLFSVHYQCYNNRDAVAYSVFKDLISPTYWQKNDSLFFERKAGTQKNYNDAVLKKERVKNGTLSGMELLIKSPGRNALKKVRLLVNRDTLYTLLSMIPENDIDSSYHQKFFTDFSVANEVAPTIYTSKAAALLATLQTKDSPLFAEASENLGLISFEKTDLPLLQNSLLEQYADSNEYTNVKASLLHRTAALADSGTLRFVANEYASWQGRSEKSKYDLLALLAEIKTTASYTLLEQLLMKPLPAAGDPDKLQYALQDSLPLTVMLFPRLLQQAGDSLFGHGIANISNQLLDSNLITPATLKTYRDIILAGAKAAVKQVQKEEAETYRLVTWSRLLGYLNTGDGNKLLQLLLLKKDLYLKQSVLLALLKNNLPVSPLQLNKVAADKGWRASFYDGLKKMGKQNLFPPLYATQKSLAESELYNLMEEEDYSDAALTYIGEQVAGYRGEKKSFQLFKAVIKEDETGLKKSYLAVAGPYTPAVKDRITETGASGIYTTEPYTPAKTAKLLKAYLSRLQEDEK